VRDFGDSSIDRRARLLFRLTELLRISRTLDHHVVAKIGNATTGRNFPHHGDTLGTAGNGMRAARAEHTT